MSRSQIVAAEKAWSQQLGLEVSGKEKSIDMAGLSNCGKREIFIVDNQFDNF